MGEIRLAPPRDTHCAAIKTHSWRIAHSPAGRKVARPFTLFHHPAVLVFGARETRLPISPTQERRTGGQASPRKVCTGEDRSLRRGELYAWEPSPLHFLLNVSENLKLV